MKICLLGEYSENLDEGMRRVSYHFFEELTKRHQVLTLDLRNVFTKTFWKDIKVFNPEIIHCIQGPSVKLFILLKIISVYCRDAKTIMSATMHPGFSFLSERFIALFTPDMILVQSDDAEEIFEKMGCETDFLPCGVDVKRFKPVTTEAKERFREKYGIEKEKFVILHIGSVKYGRNVQLLEKLQKENNQVLIVGPISAEVHLKVYQQLVEAGCLVWRKYFENIEEIYALSDCYVFPVVLKKDRMGRASADSIEMPLSVLEAMSCNLLLITTKFGALPMVFEEGNGLVFVDGDDDFIVALESIKNVDTDIKTREKVLPYSWKSIGKKLEEIYCKVMGEPKKSNGFLICFTGMDGTGKTTLSKELVKSLEERGIKCKYVYARLTPIISKLFMLIGRLIFLRGRVVSRNYLEYSNAKRLAIEKNSFLSRIYQKILLFDYLLQVFFKVKIPLSFGKNIVCDRYVYDTVITDLSVDMNYSEDKTIRLLDNILRFLSKPDITFLIDVPEEIAYQRKNDTPSIKYLSERRNTYLNVGNEYKMVILDGTKKLEELQCEIEKEVGKCL